MKRITGILLLVAAAAGVTYGVVVTQRDASYRRFVEQGDSALARDDSYAAIEAFSVAISLKSDSMAAHLKRGEAYRRRGEFDAAIRDLRRAADLDLLAIYPRELLGDVYYAVAVADGSWPSRRFGRAAERYREAVAIDEVSSRLQYKLGLASYRAGRLAPAAAALRQAVRLTPELAEAHYVLGLCLRAADQPESALRSLERAVLAGPGLLAAREELVDLQGELRRNEARLPHLEALAALQPDAARERALAAGYIRAGNLDRAIGQLAQATRRYPDDAESYVALGRVWLARAADGDRVELNKALEALSRSINNESSSDAMVLLGRALLLSGELARAEQAFQRATTRFPVAPEAFLHLADVAERRGHGPAAQRALLDYSTLLPSHALSEAVLVRVARAQIDTGDVAAARRTLDAALAKDPSNEAALALGRRLK